MKSPQSTDFEKITQALEYLERHFKAQPSLDEVAKHVELSPSHFQRLFTKWAGTSPKKFLQYLSVEHAKGLLADGKTSLLKASHKTGLSGSGRLHDLFIKIEGMTPGEFKNGGENLVINVSFAKSPFGDILLASTAKGLCYMAFVMKDEADSLKDLQRRFPKASFKQKQDAIQKNALQIFQEGKKLSEIKLHLKGTDFQIKVWEALLKIPMGGLATYGAIASSIKKPKAFRAVGTAVGENPVSFLIPCHRVIQSSGVLGNYHWGPSRKHAMIGWEGAKVDESKE